MSSSKRTFLSVLGIVLSAAGAVCGVLANTGCATGNVPGRVNFDGCVGDCNPVSPAVP